MLSVRPFRVEPSRLNGQGEVTLSIPAPARILSVEGDMPALVVYALADDTGADLERTVLIRSTEHPIDAPAEFLRFLGSVNVLNGRNLTFHIFERT